MTEARAIAHPNIALVKYWGKQDTALNLPATGSLSMTYAQFDNLRYELSYRTEVRDSNRDEKDYRYDVIGLNVQANF